jgi:hypothetical protein
MDLDARHTDGPRKAPYPHWPYTSGVCAECRHAELFAVQPRARCTHPEGAFSGLVMFAGQPSCADFAPVEARDTRLSVAADGTRETAPAKRRDAASDPAMTPATV